MVQFHYRVRRWIHVAAGTILLLITPFQAQALVIDDFEVGDFALSDNNPSGNSGLIQTGLPSENVLLGKRMPTVDAMIADPSGPSTLILTTSPSDDGVVFTTGNTDTFAYLDYGGCAGGCVELFDVTDGGQSDRFQIQIIEVTGAFAMDVMLFGEGGAGPEYIPLQISEPGTFILSFDLTSADLTNLQGIGFWVVSSSAGGGVLAISDIRSIPEPTTASLVGLGLVALALGDRRRRNENKKRLT